VLQPADIKFWEATEVFMKTPIKQRKLKIKYTKSVVRENVNNPLQNLGKAINTVFDKQNQEPKQRVVFPILSYFF
jgi:hypothetical protein